MLAHIQRVSECVLRIGGQVHARTGPGFLVLLGIAAADTEAEADALAARVVKLRIMPDEEGKMNRSLTDCGGEMMVVSQFTLLADTRRGNRPSFIAAARPEQALPLYHKFIEAVSNQLGRPAATGVFGADMQISLTNDGPVTILLDTADRPA